MSEKSPDALRTIGEVAEEVGVATHVLRFWENKFRQIKPQKRRGRRYYRPEDINTINQIKKLLYGEGYTISGAQNVLKSSERVQYSAVNENIANSFSEEKKLADNIVEIDVKPEAQNQNEESGSEQETFKYDLFGNKIETFKESSEGILGEAEIVQLKEIFEGLQAARDKLKVDDQEAA